MKHRPKMALAACGISLTLALSPAYAAPKPKRPPAAEVLAPHQTPTEQWCAYLGMLASAIAVDRDRQTPLTTTLARLRRILRADLKTLPPGDVAPITQQMTTLAGIIYADPSVPPKLTRFVFERGCVGATAQTPAAEHPWR